MKTIRVLSLVWLPLILGFLAAGCATHPPVIHTWVDSSFTPGSPERIALTEQEHPGRQDQRLKQILVASLKDAGISLVPSDHADYLLAYVFDQESHQQRVDYYDVNYDTPTDPAGPGGLETPQVDWPSAIETQVQVTKRLVTYRFTRQTIRLYLYTNPKTHAGNFQLVWQGNINVHHAIPAKDEATLVKTLVQYLGKEKNGYLKPLH